MRKWIQTQDLFAVRQQCQPLHHCAEMNWLLIIIIINEKNLFDSHDFRKSNGAEGFDYCVSIDLSRLPAFSDPRYLTCLYQHRAINWTNGTDVMLSVYMNTVSDSTKKLSQTSFPCIIEVCLLLIINAPEISLLVEVWLLGSEFSKTIVHSQKYWSNYLDSL